MMTTSRRSFLKTGSLTIAFSLSPLTHPLAQTAAAPVLPGSLNSNRMLDGWLRVNPDGTITLFTGKVELGHSDGAHADRLGRAGRGFAAHRGRLRPYRAHAQ